MTVRGTAKQLGAHIGLVLAALIGHAGFSPGVWAESLTLPNGSMAIIEPVGVAEYAVDPEGVVIVTRGEVRIDAHGICQIIISADPNLPLFIRTREEWMSVVSNAPIPKRPCT